MSSVEDLLAAIESLPDVERDKLFTALARKYGDTLALRPAQLELKAGFAVSLPGVEPDYILVFDGGARGNPGPGYGSYALFGQQDGGQEIVRLEFGGEMTNNEAEYKTLIAGLEDLLTRIQQTGRDPGGLTIEVRGDSALVINQVAGTWKAKEARMKALRGQVWALLSRFAGYNLRAHPREESIRLLGH